MTLAAKYDKMQDALADYASENDRLSAYDYCDEGYAIAVGAFLLPSTDRADYIDAAVSTHPESAQYLIACAADYRLAELTANAPAQQVAA